MHLSGSESQRLLQHLPSRDGVQWTKQLHCIPTVTFSSIYDFLVSRKVAVKKVRHVENVVDNREENGEDASDESWYESVEYTCTLDKAYRFFKDGHVQDLRYHSCMDKPIRCHLCDSYSFSFYEKGSGL